jgi:nucleoid-associated protein YgaU
MATIVANTSFAYKTDVFTRGRVYDTANANVNAANVAVPHLFYATGGTKVAQTSYVFKDSRAGGIERFVGVGEVLPAADVAVTATGVNAIK